MTHLAVGWLEKSSLARRNVIGEGIHLWQIKVPSIRIHLWQARAICRARRRPLIDWNGIHKNAKFDYWANWSLKRGGKNCRLYQGKNIFLSWVGVFIWMTLGYFDSNQVKNKLKLIQNWHAKCAQEKPSLWKAEVMKPLNLKSSLLGVDWFKINQLASQPE